VWSQQQQTIKRLEQQVIEEEQAKIYLKAQLKEAQNEMNRFGLELEALRKELINVAGLWKAKEKDCSQLMEEVAHLEKQIKRNQGAGEAIQLSKSALEMENSKIKVQL
jgi:regulator of replication initiation timing